MYLFGGKFCMREDGSRSCTCAEILGRDPGCVCDRKHFNTLLWATVTVFQASSRDHNRLRPYLSFLSTCIFTCNHHNLDRPEKNKNKKTTKNPQFIFLSCHCHVSMCRFKSRLPANPYTQQMFCLHSKILFNPLPRWTFSRPTRFQYRTDFETIFSQPWTISSSTIVCVCVLWRMTIMSSLDLDTRGLECGVVQRHGENESLGGPLFRRAHDVRQLRPLQPTRRHPRRRILGRGTRILSLTLEFFFFFLFLSLTHSLDYFVGGI